MVHIVESYGELLSVRQPITFDRGGLRHPDGLVNL